MIFCFLINLPVNVSRDYQERTIQLNKNETVTLYFYSIRNFKYDDFNEIPKCVLLLTNFVRDLVTLVISIMKIILAITITNYFKLKAGQDNSVQRIAHRNTTLNNCKMVF